MYVRGKCITFSPTVINIFLGKNNEDAGELEVTYNQVCREITAKQVKVWPFKKHLPAGKLTIKYHILHKIGVANCVSSYMLDDLIKHISTIVKFHFCPNSKNKPPKSISNGGDMVGRDKSEI